MIEWRRTMPMNASRSSTTGTKFLLRRQARQRVLPG
jgi:hypothetical protein